MESSDHITQINGRLDVFSSKITRKPNDPRATGKSAEIAIMIPPKLEPWVAAERRFRETLEEAIGENKAKTFLERSQIALAAATGDFGRMPRIAIVDVIEKNGTTYYRYACRTGLGAVIEVMGSDFAPNGLSMPDLKKLFSKDASFAAAETFTEVPPYLSRLLELDKSAAE